MSPITTKLSRISIVGGNPHYLFALNYSVPEQMAEDLLPFRIVPIIAQVITNIQSTLIYSIRLFIGNKDYKVDFEYV